MGSKATPAAGTARGASNRTTSFMNSRRPKRKISIAKEERKPRVMFADSDSECASPVSPMKQHSALDSPMRPGEFYRQYD